ncbi:Signal transduction histidine kinase [Lachnospiraceae bacterium]|nr:Signal transduction histidine kinase [Lachnospiraceae bacterium]
MKRPKVGDWIKYDTGRTFWMIVICLLSLFLNLVFMFQNYGLLKVQFTGTLLASSICGGFPGAVVTLVSYFILAVTTGAGVGKGVFLLLICLMASVFTSRGCFKTIHGTVFYIISISVTEELYMLVVYLTDAYMENKGMDSVVRGILHSAGRIVPGVLLAVAIIILFYKFIPDRILLFFGNSQHYLKDRELREHIEKSIFDDSTRSLRGKISKIILLTATVMMISSVIFVNILIANTMNGSVSLKLDFNGKYPTTVGKLGSVGSAGTPDESKNFQKIKEETLKKIDALQNMPTGMNAEVRSRLSDIRKTINQNDAQKNADSNESDAFLRMLKDQFYFYLQMIFSLLMVEMCLVLVMDSYAQRKIVIPILRVASAMDQLAYNSDEERRESLAKIHALEVQTGDEIESLYHAIDKTASELLAYLANKEKQVALENELKVAKAANDAKTSFLSSMSHEIRTPINAVLGMDEMILRESEDQTILRYAKNIQSAGKTLLGLINDILDFSKIEAGKMEIIPVDYELSSVVNDLVNMIRSKADAKKLDLVVNVDAQMPHLFRGDEIRLKQVVLNILTNAVKYTEKGSVTLSIGYRKINEKNVDLMVSVKDTGSGIREEDIEKLFAPFERIDENKNRTIEGTGLGMSITQKLLNLMDSKLELDSVYGEGSDFHFAVPQIVNSWEPVGDISVNFEKALGEQPRYQETFRAPEAHILVVDDTEMNLTVVRGLLKKTGVKIDTVTSGRQCLEKIAEKKYDIIFLDHRMPELDGVETLELMKADLTHKNQDTPVVALTANAISGAREKYISAGFSDYMTKPIDSARLERTMINFLPEDKVEIVRAEEESEEDLSALPDWVREAEGMDIDTGIRNTGSAEDFMKALQLFADNISENLKKIRLFYERSDFQNYNIKVHSLKSSARMIGAKELSEMAEHLENVSVEGSVDEAEIGEKTPELLARYEKYLEILSPLITDDTEEWMKEMNDPSKPEIEKQALDEAYGSIIECVDALDYDSIEFLIQSLMKYRIPKEEQQKIAGLRKSIAEFDWDTVEELLKQ